jgi:uncharacterized protein
MVKKFNEHLGNTPIFGMIHLAGDSFEDRVTRALDEIKIFEEEGINGCIVENYHGNPVCVEEVFKRLVDTKTKLKVGVNILPNDYESAFYIANKYGAKFIQLDVISGTYLNGCLCEPSRYSSFRKSNPDVFVMGGVHPKYYTPIPGSNLRLDLETGVKRADAIVVTGRGTGVETPLSKIQEFRGIINDYPLIDGAGLNPENAYSQLLICDAGIVGSYLKVKNKTENRLDIHKIRDFMDVVKDVRREKEC